MNNKICTALLLIFICIGLIGCGNKSNYTNKEYVITTTESTRQQTQIDWDSYRISESPIISLSDLITVNNMSLVMASFYDVDNLLLLYVDDECTKLDAYLFSLIYGKLEWQGRIENISGPGDLTGSDYYPVSMEPLVIMEKNTCKLWVIENKTVQSEVILKDDFIGDTVGDSEGIYYINETQSSIQKTDYLTGEATTIFSDSQTYEYEIRNLDYISNDGKYLYATGINKLTLEEATFVIDIQNRELIADVAGGFKSWEGKASIYSAYQEDGQWKVLSRTTENYNSVKEYRIVPQVYFDCFAVHGDIIVTEENDGAIYNFSCYDLSKGQNTASTGIDFGAYFRDAYSEEGGYSYCVMDTDNAYNSWRNMVVFEIISENNNRNVFLWDIDAAADEVSDIHAEEYDIQLNTNSISETIYEGVSDKLHNIYMEYGVAVYVGSNIPDSFADYAAVADGNVKHMETALEAVAKVLEWYPEDFFDFLSTENYSSGINIYLVGDMTTDSEGYISNPSKFATRIEEFEVMAFNINYQDSIEQNLCHEISNIIYDRINYEEIYNGKIYFDEEQWATLNPEGFEYCGGYVSEPGRDYGEAKDVANTKDEYYNDLNINNVYFINANSKTFLAEDLASLMEYSIVYMDSEFMDSPHLKAKMKFYSEAIRKVWNSENWPETTAWEANNE